MASSRPSKRPAADQPPAYQTTLPKTSLAKQIPEEDSEDDGPPKESRSRRQTQPPSSRQRGYDDADDSDPPVKDHRGGKQKATTRPSRRDDRRGRDDNGDDDRYGGSRRDNGNRARDRSMSRSRSRSRDRAGSTALVKSTRRDDRRGRYDSDDDGRHGGSRRDNGNRARDRSESRTRTRSHDRAGSTALVKRGESSRAVSKWDARSKADRYGKGSSRAQRGHSDDEEEVIKISRYLAVDIEEIDPSNVEELCRLLDVRPGKIKQWCDREIIRKDNTTGLLDLKRLLTTVDEEDTKKLTRFIKKLEEEIKTERMLGGHHHHDHGHHHRHHHHDHYSSSESRRWSRSPDSRLVKHPGTGSVIVAYCRSCFQYGTICLSHREEISVEQLDDFWSWN